MPCALASYDCFPFREPAQQQMRSSNSTRSSNSIRCVATKLRCISNNKLRSESAHEDPKLRRLLGHISIYDNVRAWSQDNEFYTPPSDIDQQRSLDMASSTPSLPESMQQPNQSLNYYYHLQVPSFQDFQAAIEAQLATVAHVAAAHLAVDVDEYDGQSDTDSDYDSYDGGWSDDDDDADGRESEASLTDIETLDADVDGCSECSSPMSLNQGWDDNDDHHDDKYDEKASEEDRWTVRPLTPLLATAIHF